MQKKISEKYILIALSLILIICIFFIEVTKTRETYPYYQEQKLAENKLNLIQSEIKDLKQSLNINISPEDIYKSGLIGEEYTEVTTTLGKLEAKQASSTAEMAALLIRIFKELNLEEGDVIGAGFSGSFPNLNLAVIVACEVLELDLRYIASAGSSQFGANNKNLTFPDMLYHLYNRQLISLPPCALSLGGDYDIGLEMDSNYVNVLRKRLEDYNFGFIYEPDYEKNLAIRKSIIEQESPLDIYISVGGHTSNLGYGKRGVSFNQGLIRPKKFKITQESGLIERYLSEGIPVLNLINIEQLFKNYGIPFKPDNQTELKNSTIFYQYRYNKWIIILGFTFSVFCFVLIYLKHKAIKENDDSFPKAD